MPVREPHHYGACVCKSRTSVRLSARVYIGDPHACRATHGDWIQAAFLAREHGMF